MLFHHHFQHFYQPSWYGYSHIHLVLLLHFGFLLLAVLLHNKLPPKHSSFSFFAFGFVDQEFRNSSAGHLFLRVSQVVAIR